MDDGVCMRKEGDREGLVSGNAVNDQFNLHDVAVAFCPFHHSPPFYFFPLLPSTHT